jgi:PhnB protein
MKINPYLNFSGQCGEAFRFYAQVLGGTLQMQTFGEAMGGEVSPEMRDHVMHVRLEVGDQVLMGSDSPPEHFQKPQGVYVSLQIDHVADAERVFHALAEGGTVTMPFEPTFWATRFGMAVDRFGTPWMVNCNDPAAS